MKRVVASPSGPDARPPLSAEGDAAVLDSDARAWAEIDVPVEPVLQERALRLFARWLLSAARQGRAGANSIPSPESQNELDCARGSKVGSDER